MIRPQPAAWFEILVARDDLAAALETLASRGCIELEAGADGRGDSPAPALQSLLERYESIERRYAALWPSPGPAVPTGDIRQAVAAAMTRIEAWAAAAAPVVESLHAAETAEASLALWREALAQIASDAIDLRALADPRATVRGALLVFPAGADVTLPPGLLGLRLAIGAEPAVLAIGQADALAAFTQQAAGARARR
jgi:hypothetical protein